MVKEIEADADVDSVWISSVLIMAAPGSMLAGPSTCCRFIEPLQFGGFHIWTEMDDSDYFVDKDLGQRETREPHRRGTEVTSGLLKTRGEERMELTCLAWPQEESRSQDPHLHSQAHTG